MRTLAFACDDNLQAIMAISDPLREDVPNAVRQCRKAGIQVKIITGDTSATALEIARQIGIIEEKEERDCHISGAEFSALSDEEAYERAPHIRVMSRARPNDKLRLVQMLQRRGEVVAVTGDGTNDAPALHYAHVGLSLGSGTSVAKAASDITIIDDSFRSIVSAVMWGRSLYQNIQRFLFFQLVVNVTALLLVLCGSFIETDLPLTVTQILWVNLIMDTFAAMALASLPPSREVMNKPPRHPDDFIITKPIRQAILVMGLTFFAVTFALLVYLRYYDSDPGIWLHDMSQFFTFFVMLQFWNLLNAKVLGSSHGLFHRMWLSKGLLIVMAVIQAGQWLIVTFGGRMFRAEPLSPKEWLAIIAATSLVLLFAPFLKKRRNNDLST
jgi:Ca2+-transporting ATPase